MDTTAKIGKIRISVILLLLIMTIIFVPQTVAKPQYLAALNFVYGAGSCMSCHTDKNGGKSLTDYGSKFKDQPVYTKDSVMALRAIGAPPGTTHGTVIPTAKVPIAIETIPVVTETIPVVTGTVSVVTNATSSVVTTTSVAEEKAGEEREKDNVSNKSPGLNLIDTIVSIGIISAMCILRKFKMGK